MNKTFAMAAGTALLCGLLATGCSGGDTSAQSDANNANNAGNTQSEQAVAPDFAAAKFETFLVTEPPMTSLRALSSSHDGAYLYAGFIKDSPKGIYKLDAQTGETVWHFQEEDFGYDKGVVADARGYVYAGNTTKAQEGSVRVYILDDETGQQVSMIEEPIMGKVGINGVDVVERDGKTLLYVVTNYGPNRIYCYDVTDVNNPQKNSGFGIDGYLDLKGALGGEAEASYLKVTEDGTLYATANLGGGAKGDSVIKVSADGKTAEKVASVKEAYGLCIAGDYMLVSTYLDAESSVEVLDMKNNFEPVASVGTQEDNTFYSAVTVAGGRIYIADQGYLEGARILRSTVIEGL